MDLEETIAEHFKVNGSGITAVYLFGSQASGKTIPGSDVDIAVLFDRSGPDFISSWIEEILLQLPKLLRKDVHPLAMNFASEALLKQIVFAQFRESPSWQAFIGGQRESMAAGKPLSRVFARR